jgi:hypothetical protein
VKSSAPHGGYHPRKQGYEDYGEKALHEDAKFGNVVKLEHSVNRAEGKETAVGNQKWVKKQEASPRRPNEKRTPPTENETENEDKRKEEKEEMISEMPKLLP